jgi:hypothetical protein
VAPTAAIISAAMRPGTTLMDVTYQITDPDDATVKVRALAFKDGVRSFANVIRPVTWMEGTETNIGDAITTGVNHTLTWDVRADWNIDLANVKFEVLCRDNRGLLPLNWITIPATTNAPGVTIGLNVPTDAQVLDGLFWLYGCADTGLILNGGILSGSTNSGVYNGTALASGSSVRAYGTAFVLKLMDIDPAEPPEVRLAISARTGISDPNKWYAANRPYAGVTLVTGWGGNQNGELNIPNGLSGVTAIAMGTAHTLALKSDATVVAWGHNGSGQLNIPAGLSSVKTIAAGYNHSIALKNDGTIVAWGVNDAGQCNIPAGLSNVAAIAGGNQHSLALKSDGTVIAWGRNTEGQCSIPAGLSGVTAITGGGWHSLALKSDGTVIAWGHNYYGQCNTPSGLSGVIAVGGGGEYSLALKSDGTVVAWGRNNYGQCNIPAGLSNVVAIAAGYTHALSLKNDGGLVTWGGYSGYGLNNIPAGLAGVIAIAAGGADSWAIRQKSK